MVDRTYTPFQRPRNKLKQIGHNPNYPRPLLYKLQNFESMAMYDPVVRQGLDVICSSLVGSLGTVTHPDPEIQSFLEDNISYLANERGIDIYNCLKRMVKVALWSGFSVTEKLYTLVNSVVYLQDLVTYHPATITIRTNKRGLLVEGDDAYEGPSYKSGIYQSQSYFSNSYASEGEVLLPRSKVCYLVHDFDFGSYYGNSILEASYRWHVLKEALVDMQIETLDKYGSPLTAITLPRTSSGVVEDNPVTGETSTLSSQEYLQRQIETGQNGNYLFLPFIDPSLKPEVKTISTGNNFNSVFMDAIRYCEQQITRNMLLPYGFIAGETETEVSERQIEIFNKVLKDLYTTFIQPFVNQVFQTTIKFSFNRESAKIPPQLPIRHITRPEERVALMQLIRGLTETGYFNPTNEVDWSMVRDMVNAVDRKPSSKDIEFVKQLLVYPRQPKETEAPAGGGQPVTTGKTEPKRDRSTEGTVKGTGGKGRPTADPAPIDKPRPLKRDSKSAS